MTQKIFDTDNADDMALLWSILPESITKLTPTDTFCITLNAYIFRCGIINIDFHDKREIIRPMPEASEADIGKLCKFWDSEDGLVYYGILNSIGSEAYRLQNTYPYTEYYHHCRRLTKQEIEELI